MGDRAGYIPAAVFVIASLHLLYINTRLLPGHAATNVAACRFGGDGALLRLFRCSLTSELVGQLVGSAAVPKWRLCHKAP